MRRLRFPGLLLTGVGLILMAFGLATVGASSANISHSYRFEKAITNGSLVSLDPKRSDFVQPANISNGSRLMGVAVVSSDSLIAVDAKANTAQVATSGNANTLVSTLNGDIKVGDQIGVSPLNGIGMKALPGSRIIGLAQTAFNSSTNGATSQEVKDKDGKSDKVYVGFVRAGIAIGNSNDSAASGIVLNDLQKLVESLTGNAVSTPKIVISLTVAIVAMIALVTLTYSAIYSSIISVGRNPLAKYAVFRTLASVIGMALLTTLVAAVTVFLLLR